MEKFLELDSILDLPCFLCEDIQRCKSGAEISPTTYDKKADGSYPTQQEHLEMNEHIKREEQMHAECL